MKKSICLFLCLPFLLSGCETEIERAERLSAERSERDAIYAEGYVKGYHEGYDEGLYAFEGKFDEEIAPNYDFLQEAAVFYAQNIGIIYPNDNRYHAYCGCWDCADGEQMTLMFVDDAIANGYKKCPDCYDGMEVSYIPHYKEFVDGYAPEECPSQDGIAYPTE